MSLLAGGLAGGTEASLTVLHTCWLSTFNSDSVQYPFEFAKTRVQLKSEGAVSSQNPFRVVGDVVKQEGFRSLYKGCASLVVVGT